MSQQRVGFVECSRPFSGPIRSIENSKPLIENQQHTKYNAKGYVQPAAGTWSGVREKPAELVREQFAFTQNSTGLAIRCKNGIILVPVVITDNEFVLPKKYLSMKGNFSVENRILDSVGMSLRSAQQTQATST